MMDIKTIFEETNDDIRNEIIDRISYLNIQCPECESIIHCDEQYQCGTCSGSSVIYVLSWIKTELENLKIYNK